MSATIKTRFRDAYHKLYGIFPELEWDGALYRSAHLPMAMSPRRLLAHIAWLERRTAA